MISACFAASAPSASFASLQNAVVTFLSVAFSNSVSISCRCKRWHVSLVTCRCHCHPTQDVDRRMQQPLPTLKTFSSLPSLAAALSNLSSSCEASSASCRRQCVSTASASYFDISVTHAAVRMSSIHDPATWEQCSSASFTGLSFGGPQLLDARQHGCAHAACRTGATDAGTCALRWRLPVRD